MSVEENLDLIAIIVLTRRKFDQIGLVIKELIHFIQVIHVFQNSRTFMQTILKHLKRLIMIFKINKSVS